MQIVEFTLAYHDGNDSIQSMRQDGRKLSSEAQHEIRKAAVRMVCFEGFKKTVAAKALGISKSLVGKAISLYEEGGWDALQLGRRGRRQGEQARLKGYQAATIVNIISERTPDQLKMPFVLWTAAAVRDYVKERFSVHLAVRTMRKYLRNWGFTPQKPIRKSWQQSSTAVAAWLEEEYPKIAADAKKRGATIYWVDETGVTNKANAQRGYSPVGKTPVLKEEGARRKVNMISAVTNRGKVRFMCYTSSMTQLKFILFLSKLLETTDGPVVVITDNLRVHHGKKVAEWVKQQDGAIELKFIPSYSPELNADEYLNRDLKKNVNSKSMPSSVKELKENIISFMRMLQKTPSRVIQYFSGRHIKYAAEYTI